MLGLVRLGCNSWTVWATGVCKGSNCTPLYTLVHPCTPLFTLVHSCTCLFNWFSRTASLFNQTKFIEWCSFGGSPTPHLQLDLKQAVTMLKIISCKDLSKFQNSSFHFLSWTELWIKVTHLKRPGGSWPKHGTRYVPCNGKPYEFSRNKDPPINLMNVKKM